MLVSSSKFPNWSSHYQTQFKGICRLDKVALLEERICSKMVTEKSEMGNRIRNIQKELITLWDNRQLFKTLVKCHYGFFHRFDCKVKYNSLSCTESSFAMIHRNLFNQKLYRVISDFYGLKQELLDNEEGAFYISLDAEQFVNDPKLSSVFQGHAFIIFKIKEEGKIVYLVAQSFVKKYSLKSFILKNKMIYGSYWQLNEKVLNPLSLILEKSENWTEKECQAHLELTSVFPGRLIGFSPPNRKLTAKFGRTSNVEIEGTKSLSLRTKVNPFPDEWKKILEELTKSAKRE